MSDVYKTIEDQPKEILIDRVNALDELSHTRATKIKQLQAELEEVRKECEELRKENSELGSIAQGAILKHAKFNPT